MTGRYPAISEILERKVVRMKTPWYHRWLLLVLAVCLVIGCTFPIGAIEPDDSIQCTEEEKQQIWFYLVDLTGNEIAAAGIMGNLYCESHFCSTNLETMGRRPPEFHNKTYAAAADDGSYGNFCGDGFGFGLAQWTFPARKSRLLQIAKDKKCSVGDLSAQLDLLAEELERYNMLYRISGSQDLEFVVEYFLKNYENPCDQSQKVLDRRIKKARDILKEYNGLRRPTQGQKTVAEIAASSENYGINPQEDDPFQWARDVYKAAGFYENPSETGKKHPKIFRISGNLDKIPIGAAIYGHTSSEKVHVGIYAGSNQVYHWLDGIQKDTLSDWILNYRGYCWGWIGGKDLTKVE